MMFEGANFLSMSHWVFGKFAVGVPHASMLIVPELLPRTSGGTSPALRGQNQILMNVRERSIAYLHTEGPALVLWEEVNERAGRLHAPSSAIVVKRGSERTCSG